MKPIKYVVEHFDQNADRVLGVFDNFHDADTFTRLYMTNRNQSYSVQNSTTSDEGFVRHSYTVHSPSDISDYWIYPVFHYKGGINEADA